MKLVLKFSVPYFSHFFLIHLPFVCICFTHQIDWEYFNKPSFHCWIFLIASLSPLHFCMWPYGVAAHRPWNTAHVRKVGIPTASPGVTCGIHSLCSPPACVICFYSLKIQLLCPADNVFFFFTSSLTLQTGVLLSAKFSNNPGSEQLSSAGFSGSDCGDSLAVWRATPVKTNQLSKKLRFTPFFLFAVRNILFW